jgi:hypothetical protein
MSTVQYVVKIGRQTPGFDVLSVEQLKQYTPI